MSETKAKNAGEEAGEAEVIDRMVVELAPDPGHDLAVRKADGTVAVATPVEAADLVGRIDTIKAAMDQAMRADLDYGVIPGTNKPALLKPGAEKLGVLFQLDLQPDNERIWEGEHLTVISRMTAFHAPTGTRLGAGEGICTTREKKYAKRKQNRKCPECGEPTVLLSKHPDRDRPDDPPGFFCWKKKGGCGAQFPHDDARIASQEEGIVDNPELPDTWNTVLKMAEKRARVATVLAVTGASALFTQDVEENQTAPGMGPVDAPPWGPEANGKQRQTCGGALTYLHDGDRKKAKAAIEAAEKAHGGYLPLAVANGVVIAAEIVKARDTPADEDPAEPVHPGDPAGEPEPVHPGDPEAAS